MKDLKAIADKFEARVKTRKVERESIKLKIKDQLKELFGKYSKSEGDGFLDKKTAYKLLQELNERTKEYQLTQ